MTPGARRAALVARREWNQRVRTATFRISTVLSVALVVGIIVVPGLYGSGGTPTRTVGLVGATSAKLPALLRAAGPPAGVRVKTRTFGDRAAGGDALRSGDVQVLLLDQRVLLWKSTVDRGLAGIVTSAVQAADRQEAVAALGLTPAQAARLLQPPRLASQSLQPATKERAARIALATIGLVLLFMAITLYGGFLLVGIVEEKSSRVVEVLLSRLRPTDLLVGKIVGIGLVGLIQFVAISAAALVALTVSGNTVVPSTTPATIGWAVFWFVLGYSFFAVVYAAAGSLVSRQEDAQSMTFPITAVLLIGYFLSFAAVQSPNSPGAVFGSLFPVSAPMVMTVRIASGGVPWWQIALAVALMLATIYGMVRLAARVYTGAVLRMGKRVKLREAWRAGRA